MKNHIHFGSEVAQQLKSYMVKEAEKIAEKYPQYRGRFDDHLLVRANKELIGRSGKICDAGTILLADPEILQFEDELGNRHQSICIWDMAEQSAKYVSYSDVDFIEKDVKLTLRLEY